MSLHVVHPVQLAGVGVETVDEARKVTDEQQAVVLVDRDCGDASLDSLVRPDLTALGDVALLGRVEADKMADAFSVLGVLSVRHVHATLIKHRSRVDLIRPLGGRILDRLAVFVLLILGWVGIVPPDFAEKVEVLVFVVDRLRLEGVTPAVATAEEELTLAIDHAVGGRTPLAVVNVRADAGVVLAEQFTGLGVESDKAWGERGGDVRVRPVLPVGGAGVDDVAHHDHRAVGGVVREHAQLVHHVVAPDNVTVLLADLGRWFSGIEMHVDRLVLVRAVVAVGQALGVEAEHFAAAGYHVDAIAHHGRRG